MKPRRRILAISLATLLYACSSPSASTPSPTPVAASGIHKIQHVVVIMQENRSFDSYFGTYPGADGLPSQNGVPTSCVPDSQTGQCVKPTVDHADVNGGGPHSASNATADINGGQMNGFLNQALGGRRGCLNTTDPARANGTTPDVMPYPTLSDTPNYWSYAKNYVLQDHMFEPNASWSLPEHLFQVSEWSANCKKHDDPSSCTNALQNPGNPPGFGGAKTAPIYAWTDLTYLLHQAGVSWGYYVLEGTEPDCQDDEQEDCLPVQQNAKTPGIWNPLPFFDTVKNDGELENVQSLENFLLQAERGTLPQVAWVVPSGDVSEHPPALVSAGQTFV